MSTKCYNILMKNITNKITAYLILTIIIWFILCFVSQSWLNVGETIGVLLVLSVIFFLVEKTGI